ncbi:MAG: hypothetical protein JNL70_06475 [Saprospiraceae bacterium]|nr:hypothetical protein [Saprospiraceae bacterium]
MALIPTSFSPLISLAAFGVSLLMMGGFFGNEMARRRETKQEIKEIQLEQKRILAHMDSVYQSAVLREQKALEQVEMVYSTLNMLTEKEGKERKNLAEIRTKVQKGQEALKTTTAELKQAATKSAFIID